MKSFSAKSTTVIPAILFALSTILLTAPAINAQREAPGGGARPSPNGGTVPEMARQPSVRERQLKVTEMERDAARTRTVEEEHLALSQIADDYEKIQVINNKMMAATMPKATPDYAQVAEVTAEIKQRANRMKDNLRLPKPDPRADAQDPPYKKIEDAAALKANLLLLDGSIMSFLKSPIFTNPSVVDVEQAKKASSELQTIIEFSGLISKDAQKLKKLAGKTP